MSTNGESDPVQKDGVGRDFGGNPMGHTDADSNMDTTEGLLLPEESFDEQNEVAQEPKDFATELKVETEMFKTVEREKLENVQFNHVIRMERAAQINAEVKAKLKLRSLKIDINEKDMEINSLAADLAEIDAQEKELASALEQKQTDDAQVCLHTTNVEKITKMLGGRYTEMNVLNNELHKKAETLENQESLEFKQYEDRRNELCKKIIAQGVTLRRINLEIETNESQFRDEALAISENVKSLEEQCTNATKLIFDLTTQRNVLGNNLTQKSELVNALEKSVETLQSKIASNPIDQLEGQLSRNDVKFNHILQEMSINFDTKTQELANCIEIMHAKEKESNEQNDLLEKHRVTLTEQCNILDKLNNEIRLSEIAHVELQERENAHTCVKQEINRIKNEISLGENEFSTLESERDLLLKTIDELELRNRNKDTIAAECDKLEMNNNNLKSALSKLTAEKAILENDIDSEMLLLETRKSEFTHLQEKYEQFKTRSDYELSMKNIELKNATDIFNRNSLQLNQKVKSVEDEVNRTLIEQSRMNKNRIQLEKSELAERQRQLEQQKKENLLLQKVYEEKQSKYNQLLSRRNKMRNAASSSQEKLVNAQPDIVLTAPSQRRVQFAPPPISDCSSSECESALAFSFKSRVQQQRIPLTSEELYDSLIAQDKNKENR